MHTTSPVLANLIAHMTVNTIAHNNAPTRQIDSARDKLLFIFEGNIIVPHYCGLDSLIIYSISKSTTKGGTLSRAPHFVNPQTISVSQGSIVIN